MVRVELRALGTPRQTILNLPKELTISVTRDDGYPSKGAIDRMEAYATGTLTWDEFFNGSAPDPAA